MRALWSDKISDASIAPESANESALFSSDLSGGIVEKRLDRRTVLACGWASGALSLAGCASKERFTTQALKPGKARVYVYGAPFMFKSIAGYAVKVDGEYVGSVGPEYYASLDLAPGPHTVEIVPAGLSGRMVSLTVAAGETYYVRGEMRPIEGTAAGTMHPTIVSREVGSNEIVTMSPS